MSSRPFLLVVVPLFCVVATGRGDETCSATVSFESGKTSEKLPGVTRKEQSIFVSVGVNEKNEVLKFLFDTGAGRTVIARKPSRAATLRSMTVRPAPVSTARWPRGLACERQEKVRLAALVLAESMSML